MSDEKEPLRDYGFGDSPKVDGPPRLMGYAPEPCPHCSCTPVFKIEAILEEAPPNLKVPPGHQVVGMYVGCAACPWASPMITRAQPKGN